MPTVSIGFRASDIAYAEESLKAIANGANTAIRSAINDTLKSERAEMVRRLTDEINLPASDIRRRINITDRPKPYSLSGTLTVDYEGVPLEKFKPRTTKGGGTTVTMLKSEGPVTFRHAFKASMPSGHSGVFSRRKMPVFSPATTAADLINAGFDPGNARQLLRGNPGTLAKLYGRGIRHQKRLAVGGNFPKVTPKGIAWRLPIDTYRGVPVVAVFEHKPQLLDDLAVDASERFHDRLMSKVDWLLARGNANFPGSSA